MINPKEEICLLSSVASVSVDQKEFDLDDICIHMLTSSIPSGISSSIIKWLFHRLSIFSIFFSIFEVKKRRPGQAELPEAFQMARSLTSAGQGPCSVKWLETGEFTQARTLKQVNIGEPY